MALLLKLDLILQLQSRYPPDGVLFIIDRGNHCIRYLKDGHVRTLAGQGYPGFVDGFSSSALFSNPISLALAPDGSLYVADTDNHRIRRIYKQIRIRFHGGAENFTDLDIPFCSTVFKTHRCFIKLRCPALLNLPTWLQTEYLDPRIIDSLKEYLYTDILSAHIPPEQLLGLAVRVVYLI